MLQLTGYSDRYSGSPGDTIKFYVNSEKNRRYKADIVRLIHGDTNPDGPGFKEELLRTPVSGEYPGRNQVIYGGSYVVVPDAEPLRELDSFTLQLFVWSTTAGKGVQGLLTKWLDPKNSGYGLFIGDDGAAQFWIGDGKVVEKVSAGKPILHKVWYLVAASFSDGNVTLYQQPLLTATNGGLGMSLLHPRDETESVVTKKVSIRAPGRNDAPLLLAAHTMKSDSGRRAFGGHFREAPEPVVLPVHGGCFNGKLDSPAVTGRPLDADEIGSVARGLKGAPSPLRADVRGRWDFAANITKKGVPSTLVVDTSSHRLDGYCVNLPARGMTGYNWTGDEISYTHAPEEYGAVHFHDDDIDDARWDADFEWTIPEKLKSGVYAARLKIGKDDDPINEDYIPVFVSPKRGTANAKLAVIIPTGSYLAYANDNLSTNSVVAQLLAGKVAEMQIQDLYLNEHREYGLSTYSLHSDGSGVGISSRLRPLLNMRPKYRHWLSPSLWQLNGDLHLTDWLEKKGIAFDLWTDEDVDREGVDLLARYRVVLTGTHPEYSSENMVAAYENYQHAGGRWLYLGADGFYWVIVFHPDNPNIIEVRKGEAGTRAWTANPGEYSNAFDGKFGGMWRARGRIPSKVCGLTFTGYGFDVSSYYRRCPDSLRPECKWMFEGIAEDEIIGDFGLVGGGAAGLELDRYDLEFGTPHNAYLLARSEGHTDLMLQVNEEIHFAVRAYYGGGDENPQIRADMIYYKTPSGGAVWAPGSLAWCGSLSWNNYNNNVSRLMENVIRGFLAMDELP